MRNKRAILKAIVDFAFPLWNYPTQRSYLLNLIFSTNGNNWPKGVTLLAFAMKEHFSVY